MNLSRNQITRRRNTYVFSKPFSNPIKHVHDQFRILTIFISLLFICSGCGARVFFPTYDERALISGVRPIFSPDIESFDDSGLANLVDPAGKRHEDGALAGYFTGITWDVQFQAEKAIDDAEVALMAAKREKDRIKGRFEESISDIAEKDEDIKNLYLAIKFLKVDKMNVQGELDKLNKTITEKKWNKIDIQNMISTYEWRISKENKIIKLLSSEMFPNRQKIEERLEAICQRSFKSEPFSVVKTEPLCPVF